MEMVIFFGLMLIELIFVSCLVCRRLLAEFFIYGFGVALAAILNSAIGMQSPDQTKNATLQIPT
jgi:hypothetical protein